MIKGLSADNARPFPQQTAPRKTEKAETSNFADQLLGAKSEPSRESPKRTERKQSGRDADREDSRSAEREKDSRNSTDLRERRLEARRADRRARLDRDERDDKREARETALPSASPIPQPTVRVPSSQDDAAPIVVEKPKDASDSQDLKLPDFFSKASLEKGATKETKADGQPLSETAAALAAMKENEGLTRQEAMENFIQKMNDELGIPPQKLLQAFAKLDDQAMQESPEESMGQLMANLGLDEAGEAKAAALYRDLLKTTGDSLVNERLAGLDSSVNFDVMSPRDSALRKLNTSLDDLNDSFFKKDAGDAKKAQKDLEAMDLAIAKMMRDPQAQTAPLANAQALAAQDSEGDADAAAALDSSQQDLLAALGALNAQPAEIAQAQSEGDGDLADLLGQRQEQGSVKATKSSLKSAFAEEMAEHVAKADKDETVDADSALKPEAKIDPQAAVNPDLQTAPGTPKAVLGPADMMMGKQPTAKDEQENVKELIKQAQIMVKRGGGEMKMEMKPEGMGSIHLRVNVENGQVNVQMLTESESAKHLLEKGLHELKSNLAQHELKVQSMTVDVGNDVKNQMDQQATQDQARQRAQQFAQDFMGSFRDEQQGFRQGFLENRGWKSYARGAKGPDSIQPEQVERAASASRRDTSKRLNLVA